LLRPKIGRKRPSFAVVSTFVHLAHVDVGVALLDGGVEVVVALVLPGEHGHALGEGRERQAHVHLRLAQAEVVGVLVEALVEVARVGHRIHEHADGRVVEGRRAGRARRRLLQVARRD
jgi:hypothetical protein